MCMYVTLNRVHSYIQYKFATNTDYIMASFKRKLSLKGGFRRSIVCVSSINLQEIVLVDQFSPSAIILTASWISSQLWSRSGLAK